MYEDIENALNRNLSRVYNLADAYHKLRRHRQGRQSVMTTDLLRAGVVFLHASLEEALRALVRQKLPDAEASALDNVPLAGKGRRSEKLTLGDLIQYKGKTVDELIRDSVEQHCDQISFSNTTEIVSTRSKSVPVIWRCTLKPEPHCTSRLNSGGYDSIQRRSDRLLPVLALDNSID